MQAERAPLVLRPFTNGMRSPVIAPVVRSTLAIPLFIFSASTATLFAWTIEPPLTACILGANYFASVALAVWAAREHWWANGRLSASVALVFAPITTVATFLHLNLFHTGSSGWTLFITWFWIVAYAVYPLQLLWMLRKQLMTPGGDPPRTQPLPGWLKSILVGQALVLIPVGAVMFVSPTTIAPGWPWANIDGAPIAALSMQALSAWALAFGVLAAHVVRENDLNRVRCGLLAFPVMVLLHLVALLRFGDAMVWSRPSAYLYVAYLASGAVVGVYGIRNWRKPPEPKWIEVSEEESDFTE